MNDLPYLKEDASPIVIENSYEILQNTDSELLFCIRDREGEPEDPVILYSGGTNALLLRRPDQFILLDEINPDVRKPLTKVKEALIAEFNPTEEEGNPSIDNKSGILREYMVKICIVHETLESPESVERIVKNGDPLKRTKGYLERKKKENAGPKKSEDDGSGVPDWHEICP
jgi:hypothetical protein